MPGAITMPGARAGKKLLRMVRAALGMAGFGPRPEAPYRPMLDERELASRLGGEPAPAAQREAAALTELQRYAGARRARSLFAARFFVDPEKIATLSRDLDCRRRDLVDQLRSRVRTDIEDGLPLYSIRTWPLGPDFRWSDLPEGPGGDRMYAKRPHRFAFLPRHAWACLEGCVATDKLRGMLESWLKYAKGATDQLCYDSNLGVFQRVLALVWGWAFLAARPEEESDDGLGLEWLLLRIIYADVRYLEPRLGDSVPNNHLLADRFAAWLLSTLIPEFMDNVTLATERQWCDELLAQTYPDGGSFEHSSHYHEFASEMGAAYLILAECNGLSPCPEVVERTRALLEYQCVLTGPESVPESIGSAVEDTLFPLDAGESWCAGALREIYRTLFDPGIESAPVGDPSLVRAYWLLAGRIASAADGDGESRLRRHFPYAGLHVFSDNIDGSRISYRTGPAPDTTVVAGHMHADLLSIYLRSHGRPLLIDAGTFSYRGRNHAWSNEAHNWRKYFSGPAAHNGFTLQGCDPLGNFPGDFRPRETTTRVHQDARTDGVLSYVEGRVHSANEYHGLRRVVLHVAGSYWLILDLLPDACRQQSGGWYGFQCAPDIGVTREGRTMRLMRSGGLSEASIMHCPNVDEPQVLDASLDPVGGWVSPRYGERTSAPQLRYHVPEGTQCCAFVVCTNERFRDARVLNSLAGPEGAQLVVVGTDGIQDWFIYQPDGLVAWHVEDDFFSFDGRLAWLRFDETDNDTSLRWIAGKQLVWANRSINVRADSDRPANLAIGRDSLFAGA